MKKDEIKSARALKYDSDEDIAPKVIAKGDNFIAKNMVEKAEELDIPIYRDEKIVHQLRNLEINDNIPQELYEAIAQVLIFITKLDKK